LHILLNEGQLIIKWGRKIKNKGNACITVLMCNSLLELLQSQRQVKLERLASVFPYPITTESRRRKLQRFLSLPQLTINRIWYPIITYWLTTYCQVGQTLSIVIDRTWRGLHQHTHDRPAVWEKRAIPLSWSLLPKRRKQQCS
jgi:hypothetical protein